MTMKTRLGKKLKPTKIKIKHLPELSFIFSLLVSLVKFCYHRVPDGA